MFLATTSQALDGSSRAHLMRLVETSGERATLELLGIGRQVLYRALAGLTVRRGSIALIERALEKTTLATADTPEGGASD